MPTSRRTRSLMNLSYFAKMNVPYTIIRMPMTIWNSIGQHPFNEIVLDKRKFLKSTVQEAIF